MFMKRILLIVVGSCALLLAASTVSAQVDGYITIANNIIVTNPGQRPQVVVQFGNRSNTTIENVDLICGWPTGDADLGAVFPGPFDTVSNLVIPNAEFAVFGSDPFTGFIIDDVDLIPGQNYNIAFNLEIIAPSGTESFVNCFLFSNIATFLDSVDVPMIVQ